MDAKPSVDRLRIGIYGSYGGYNLGDEAILHSIVADIRSRIRAELTVFSRNVAYTLKNHRVERAVANWNMSREEVRPEVERLDFLILGGGGIFFDADARSFLREPMLALERDIPVMVYSVSAGPLENYAIRHDVHGFLEAATAVTVRDRKTHRLFEELGVRRRILLTADPAVSFMPSNHPVDLRSMPEIDEKRRLIGMSVRDAGPATKNINEKHYQEILADSADFMVERFGADILFVPMEPRGRDMQQAHAVIARMLRAEHAVVLLHEYSPGELLAGMGKLDFCVGMRLHFLLFSALQGVPFVGLPYSPKVHAFLEDMEMDEPPINLVSSGRLIAHIDEAWDNRAHVVNHIGGRLPALRARAAKNIEIAVDLLRRRYGSVPSP
ncbi:MAG: polysaccharide pyruvyl transferase [Chitinivibrionales bacterium]|nr:polysaccharide pyruvyl transferase [Chitinivibrionales bacterium]MBD3358439.1 polysaccharide pyruvyl transferase [Chitinivibrionales bacterium]